MGLVAVGAWGMGSTHLSENMQKTPAPRRHPSSQVNTARDLWALQHTGATSPHPQGPLVRLRPRDMGSAGLTPPSDPGAELWDRGSTFLVPAPGLRDFRKHLR